MLEEGCQYMNVVKNETQTPYGDRAQERSHAEDVVRLEPGEVVREEQTLGGNG